MKCTFLKLFWRILVNSFHFLMEFRIAYAIFDVKGFLIHIGQKIIDLTDRHNLFMATEWHLHGYRVVSILQNGDHPTWSKSINNSSNLQIHTNSITQKLILIQWQTDRNQQMTISDNSIKLTTFKLLMIQLPFLVN